MHGNNPYPYLSGTADSSANTPSRRNRDPTGFIPVAPSAAVPGVPAMLDITAVNPMYTLPRGPANLFVPDAQMLFHVLGICDGMMNSTDHFTRSFPGWLPIVSHLYISVLWNFTILKVFVNSGHGAMFDLPHFQISECMIPGPLVPFFQSLAAVSGPFDWIGDIVPHLPGFSIFWNAAGFHANSDYARQVPVPALILDQLYHFATWQIPEDTTIFDKFEWYGNIFSQDIDTHNSFNRMGPQLCGSLWTSSEQLEAARWFWSAAFGDIRFSRVDATRDPFSHYQQLFGFVSQTGTPQHAWFQNVNFIMQNYAQYFNESVPLKCISLEGVGAGVVHGDPRSNAATRDWVYPTMDSIAPFLTGRFGPRREIPDDFAVKFQHADLQIEKLAERYAIVAHTNIRWPGSIAAQNDWPAINDENLHVGDYWKMKSHRLSSRISVKAWYALMIASQYHTDRPAANHLN